MSETFEKKLKRCKEYTDTYNLMYGKGKIETYIDDEDIVMSYYGVGGIVRIPDFITRIGSHVFKGSQIIRI